MLGTPFAGVPGCVQHAWRTPPPSRESSRKRLPQCKYFHGDDDPNWTILSADQRVNADMGARRASVSADQRLNADLGARQASVSVEASPLSDPLMSPRRSSVLRRVVSPGSDQFVIRRHPSAFTFDSESVGGVGSDGPAQADRHPLQQQQQQQIRVEPAVHIPRRVSIVRPPSAGTRLFKSFIDRGRDPLLWDFEVRGVIDGVTAASKVERPPQREASRRSIRKSSVNFSPRTKGLRERLHQLEAEDWGDRQRRRSPSLPRMSIGSQPNSLLGFPRPGTASSTSRLLPSPSAPSLPSPRSRSPSSPRAQRDVDMLNESTNRDLHRALSDLMGEIRREDVEARRQRKLAVQCRGVVPRLLRRRKARITPATAAALSIATGDCSWARQLRVRAPPRVLIEAAAEAMADTVRLMREEILEEESESDAEGDGSDSPRDRHSCIPEIMTGLVPKDLHNYMLYCSSNKVNIILRPISQAAYSIYSGEFHLSSWWNDTLTGYPDWDKISPFREHHDQKDYQLIHQLRVQLHTITHQRMKASAKGINVSLKSSPYGPIAGLIPLDPQLSKVANVHAEYLRRLEEKVKEAEQEERRQEMAEMRRRSSPTHLPRPGQRRRMPSLPDAASFPQTPRSPRVSISPTGRDPALAARRKSHKDRMASLKVMEDSNMLLLQKLEQDYTAAMERSREAQEEMMRQYRRDSVLTMDKLKVSLSYIDDFNQRQFLGGQVAKDVLGNPIYHFTYPHAEGLHQALVVRDASSDPIFATRVRNVWNLYDNAQKTFVARPRWSPERHWRAAATMVITNRKFIVNEVTKRIEEVEPYLIVPDYDGLSWSPDQQHPVHVIDADASDEDNIALLTKHFLDMMWARLETTVVPSFGGVSAPDKEHVEEMRILTDWRQNHGYEYQNLTKTQDMLAGAHVSIESDQSVRILETFSDIVQHYGDMWRRGVPHMLNPNWPVYLDASGRPRTLDRDTTHPLYDDAQKLSGLAERARQEGTTMDRVKTRAAELQRSRTAKDRAGRLEPDPIVPFPTKGVSELVREYVRVMDEKRVMSAFWDLRKVLLYPPLLLCRPSPLEELVEECEGCEDKGGRELVDRLMSRVVRNVQLARDDRAAELRVRFRRQLHRFRRKHGDVDFASLPISLVDEEHWSEDEAGVPGSQSPPDSPRDKPHIDALAGQGESKEKRALRHCGRIHREQGKTPRVQQWGMLGQRADSQITMRRTLQHSHAIAAGLKNWISRSLHHLATEGRSSIAAIDTSDADPSSPAHSRRVSVASRRTSRAHRRERPAREALRITKRAMGLQLFAQTPRPPHADGSSADERSDTAFGAESDDDLSRSQDFGGAPAETAMLFPDAVLRIEKLEDAKLRHVHTLARVQG